MKKKLIGLFVIALLLFTGCGSSTGKEKVFDEGDFKITLNTNFEKSSLSSVTYYYENNKEAIGASVLLETYESLKVIDISKDTDLDTYAGFIIKQVPTATMKKEGKFNYFTYSKTIAGSSYFYMAAMFKGEKGFYLMNFWCNDKDKDTNLNKFITWEKTVEV